MYVEIRQCTEVRFASSLSGGFITSIVVNPPERKLAKRTSVQWLNFPKQAKSQKLLNRLLVEIIKVREKKNCCFLKTQVFTGLD